MSRDDHTKTTPETKASTSSSKAIISSEENDDDSSSWSRFKTKVSECFWDFEAELADWFGLNASKFYEELEMKKDFNNKYKKKREKREENLVKIFLCLSSSLLLSVHAAKDGMIDQNGWFKKRERLRGCLLRIESVRWSWTREARTDVTRKRTKDRGEGRSCAGTRRRH